MLSLSVHEMNDMDGEFESNKRRKRMKKNRGILREKHIACLQISSLKPFLFFLKNTFHKCTEHIIFASPLDISYNFIISVGTCLRAFEVTA